MFDTIIHRNSAINYKHAGNVLIIYDQENKMFIGDSYILMNKLSSCRYLFDHASIDINCRNLRHTSLCRALLANNPFIRHFCNTSWEELDFHAYDIVLCISADESPLLQAMEAAHRRDPARPWTTAVYSMSVQFLNYGLYPVTTSLFPPFTSVIDSQAPEGMSALSELYISEEEKEWANHWLYDNGVHENDQLFIILDSTSEKEKLVNMDTYYTLLCHLLEEPSVRLLIYDEQDIGKAAFYHEWLGQDKASKIIFARKLGLRKDLTILASDHTRLVFGPCTGLVHCASGIYNHFIRKGMPAASVPSIITYTGKYTAGHTAHYWWGSSPLVTCLILRKTADGGQEVVSLSQLSDDEKMDTSRLLGCGEYLAKDIIPFLPSYRQEMII